MFKETVDAIIKYEDKIVLVKRKNIPFKDMWALPGGFVEKDEMLQNAVKREVKEETNVRIKNIKLFGVYQGEDRDPRGYVRTTVFLSLFDHGLLRSGSDAKEVGLFTLEEISKMQLAFDHNKIIGDATECITKI